jgi:hypothetical protein
VVQGGGNNNSVTIVFKEFGVRLSFTPTVLGDGLINLKVKPEVSSLDFANGVSISGFRVPALSTRRTETEVELQDGQTFAIAGLMNNTVSSTMSKVPGIGDIPILGYLFRSRAYQKAQTELVVMITPQIIKRGSPGVSEGLPSISEAYLTAPKKPMAQPTPYVGSPRYPVPAGAAPSRTDDAAGAPAQGQPAQTPAAQPQAARPQSTPAPVKPAPVQTPAPSSYQSPAPAAKPAPVPPVATAPPPAAPKASAPAPAPAPMKAEAPAKLTKADLKAIEQQRIAERRAADAAAKAKAVDDKKAAEDKARQDKLDAEQAKKDAVTAKAAAKKNTETDAKKLEEQKKRDKAVNEAAERLKLAQAAYDKSKGQL